MLVLLSERLASEADSFMTIQPRLRAESLPLTPQEPVSKGPGPGAFEVRPGEAQFSSDCCGKSWIAAMCELSTTRHGGMGGK